MLDGFRLVGRPASLIRAATVHDGEPDDKDDNENERDPDEYGLRQSRSVRLLTQRCFPVVISPFNATVDSKPDKGKLPSPERDDLMQSLAFGIA